EEAEAAVKQAPGDNAVRNLSLALKKLGTCARLLARFDEALAYYRRALTLDQERVEHLQGSAESRLDLSFAYESVGDLLIDTRDLDGAREQYRQVLELRRAVTAEDPGNERAVASLADAYALLANVEIRAGQAERALEAHEARLKVLRDRA